MSDRATLKCISTQKHEEICARRGALLEETYIASHKYILEYLLIYY